MLIRYKGGRSRYEVSLNRKPYYFTPENNKICDIKEQAVINYIFSLSNRSEFEAVMEEKTPEIKADVEIPIVEKSSNSKKHKKGKKNG